MTKTPVFVVFSSPILINFKNIFADGINVFFFKKRLLVLALF